MTKRKQYFPYKAYDVHVHCMGKKEADILVDKYISENKLTKLCALIYKGDIESIKSYEHLEEEKNLVCGEEIPLYPLFLSLNFRDCSIFKFLISIGAGDPRPTDVTILHGAVSYKNEEAVKTLLMKGFPFIRNEYGMTPLHYAVKKGDMDIIELLITYKNKYAIDFTGANAAIYAIKEKNLEVLSLLLKKSLPTNKRGISDELDTFMLNSKDLNDMTLLHFAAIENDIDMVNFLLDLGLKQTRDCHGRIPLFYCIAKGDMEIIKLLSKDHIDTAADDGITALHVAADNNRSDVVKYLILEKAKVKRDNLGMTPLILAIPYRNFEIINLLLAVSDINLGDNNGNTPLHYAINYRNLELVELLIKLGSKDKENKLGLRPIHYAADSRDIDMIMAAAKGVKGPDRIKIMKNIEKATSGKASKIYIPKLAKPTKARKKK